MAITVQEIVYRARALVDEYNEDGSTIPASEVATIETNAILFVDMAQQEMFKQLEVFKKYEFFNTLEPNLLGNISNFNQVVFEGTDQNYPENGVVGAKAYYFEVDDDATVYVEEYNGSAWNTLITVSVSGITQPTAYKGLITATDSSYPIRLRFSGTTAYKHINRCLFSRPYKSDKIPDYTPWVKKEMPSDFGELHRIIGEYPDRQYQNQQNYKWEGFNELYFNYYYEGSLRVIYKPIPTTVSALTDVMDINDPISIQFIIYYTAAKIATSENKKLVNFYEQKANELKFEAQNSQPKGEEKIQDVYFCDYFDNTVAYIGGGW